MVPPLFSLYIIIMRLFNIILNAFQALIKDSLRLRALYTFIHERPI